MKKAVTEAAISEGVCSHPAAGSSLTFPSISSCWSLGQRGFENFDTRVSHLFVKGATLMAECFRGIAESYIWRFEKRRSSWGSFSSIAWEMPAPDRDPLCPRKVTLLRGVGAKETDQTKASPCIRLKLHLVLKFTVTGSPVLNLRPPYILDSYSLALDSPLYSVKEPKYSYKPCSHLPEATLQATSKLCFGLLFHLRCAVHTPHTSSTPHRNYWFLYPLPTKGIASQSNWWWIV